MRPRAALLGLLLAWAGPAACPGDEPKATPAQKDRAEDEKALREHIEAFRKAFDAGDADAIAAQFAEDARVVDPSGEVFEGRDAIRDRFAEGFEAQPGRTIVLDPQSIQFLTDDVAIEEGVASILPPRPEGAESDPAPISRDAYTVLYVKRDGRWQTANIRDHAGPVADDGPDEGDLALAELDWLVGEWVDESEAAVIHTDCRWSDDRKYLLRDFQIRIEGRRELQGTQRIGWDPIRGQIRSWVFDSDGSFVEGFWSRVSPDRWAIKGSGYLRDGRTLSVTNVITKVNPHTMRWRTLDQIVGEDAVDDLEEITIVRRPPKPE
jgi:uncharacterized protein (TIGR02246 family)